MAGATGPAWLVPLVQWMAGATGFEKQFFPKLASANGVLTVLLRALVRCCDPVIEPGSPLFAAILQTW